MADYYLILAGQEVESPGIGHLLVFGADVSIEAGTSLADIRTRFPNAAVIWAHPYRNEGVPSREQLLNPLFNGIEIFNSNHTVAENNRGLIDWHRYKFTAVSGTDTHAISYTGLYPTFFDHPFSTLRELADEISAGRCRPFFKEIQRAGTSDTRMEVSIGTAGRLPDRFVVRSHADPDSWRSSARSMHIIDEISRQGFDKGRYRVPARDARQNSIGYKFDFMLFLLEDKPTPTFCLIAENSVVGNYYPLIFYRRW